MDFCGACTRGDKQSPGNQWCEDCKEVLCNDCEIAHRINKLTLDHHLTEDVPPETPSTPAFYSKAEEFKVNIEDELEARQFIILSTGEFLFLDTEYPKMILYDTKEKCVKGTCEVPRRSSKMAEIPGTGYVIFSAYNIGTFFFNYKTMKLGKNIVIEGKAVNIIDNKLVIAADNYILFFSMSGRLLNSISLDKEFKDAIASVSKGPNNTFICMDTNQSRAVCIDDKGKELWFYETPDLGNADTCFVDDKSNIYVGNSEVARIHQLTPDGMVLNDNLLDEYLAEGEVVWDFLFNKDFSELYLLKPSNTIAVYKRK